VFNSEREPSYHGPTPSCCYCPKGRKSSAPRIPHPWGGSARSAVSENVSKVSIPWDVTLYISVTLVGGILREGFLSSTAHS